MAVRKWLEKRPTFILKEPLIKKLSLSSFYHRFAFEMGTHLGKAWEALEERDAPRLYGHVTAVEYHATVDFGIDIKDERKRLHDLIIAKKWDEARAVLTDIETKLIRELERFREPIVIRRIPIPR